ncbi:MAG: AAC(3) family N-acetyltransferase [Methanobacteriota archaeon]|nr:MAG: AAC(3) family N-acetyltransferase [Euryarchaeota archaeon]
MTEAEAIERTKGMPATISSMSDDLLTLGVTAGSTLLVHSSLSSLGWVCGGAVSVVLALEKALGVDGTLVMPTHSGDLSDPSRWRNPPIPEQWWDVVRDEAPAFDVDMTPSRGMGVIPECFRRQRGTMRSAHPSVSFAARGPMAEALTEVRSLDFPAGEGSLLARLYDLDGHVLLVGADFRCATSLHLAECRASYPGRKVIRCGAPVIVDGERRWVEFDDIEYDDSDFIQIGVSFSDIEGNVRSGPVACGRALLMSQRALVDHAVRWMEENRA